MLLAPSTLISSEPSAVLSDEGFGWPNGEHRQNLDGANNAGPAKPDMETYGESDQLYNDCQAQYDGTNETFGVIF